MREDLRMIGTNPARVPPPGVPAPADRFPRRVARLLNWGPAQVTVPALRWTVNGLTWTGALLMLASAIIHVRLWADGGYQGIAVIGPLFLAQGVAGILLAAAAAIVLAGRPRRRPRACSERVWPPAD